MARRQEKRRRAVDRYAALKEPQAELDFHGRGALTGREVKQETLHFVQAAKARGLTRLRIVTGRGVHSKAAPVVRPQVDRTLRGLEADGIIDRYGPEALGRGGEGAFWVAL